VWSIPISRPTSGSEPDVALKKKQTRKVLIFFAVINVAAKEASS
jgi:hypothetical protein